VSNQYLHTTYFKCSKCQSWRTVEAQGEIMAGPFCKVCHIPMRVVQIQQLDLGLFHDAPLHKKRPSKRTHRSTRDDFNLD
jgi:hypothetical protein